MDYKQKDIDGISECIAEAERYLVRCKKLKESFEARTQYDCSQNIHHSAALRAGIDLRRVISKFTRRAKDGNYKKTWSECD